MNWLLLVVFFIIAVYTIRGYRYGLIKTVFLMFSVFIALTISTILTPVVSEAIQNNKVIYTFIEEKVQENINTQENNSKKDESEIINNLELPESIKNILEKYNTSEVYEKYSITSFKEYLNAYITGLIINAISFIIVFIITYIILKVVAGVIDIISKLPIIHTLNKIGGVAIGFCHGLFIIWIGCIILMVFSTTDVGREITKCINESTMLTFIYNNNVLLKFATNLLQSFL